MQAPVFSISGAKMEKITLPKGVFGTEASPTLLAQAVRVYLANQRAASAKTKTRGEVEGSTKKIFRQKGTGRARHGAIRAPIFVGGGISHGPDGMQHFELEMPKKMRKLAMAGALNEKADAKQITIIDGASKATGKTREASALRTKMEMATDKILMVSQGSQKKLDLGWRNLNKVTVTHVNALNAYTVLAHKQIVFTQEALDALAKQYAN